MTTEKKSPFTRPSFIAAAAVIAVIVIAATVVIAGAISRGNQNLAAVPGDVPSETAHASTADASVCGLKGFETTNTLTSAPETKWVLVGTVAAPTDSNGTGPGVTEEGFRSCYAHTAEGALFAATNWFALSSDARNVPRLTELVEPGKGSTAAAAAAAAAGSSERSDTRLQVAGFKINSYDGQEAIVDVAWAVTSKQGALVSFPTVLHWVDGDWKIVLADDGSFPYSASPLENLGGYTPWAGV